MQEEWRDIKDYEGMYQVSNLGRIRGVNRFTSNNRLWKGKILKTHVVHNYVQVRLCKNGRLKNYKVHRLVALAFISNPDNLLEVNHKDENKLNNVVNNLEWCSRLYNNTYHNRHKKVGEKLHKAILQYTISGEFVKRWDSLTSVRDYFNLSTSSGLRYALRNKSKRKSNCTAYGYVWKYEDSLNEEK